MVRTGLIRSPIWNVFTSQLTCRIVNWTGLAALLPAKVTFEVMFTNELNKSEQIVPLFAYNKIFKIQIRDNINYIPSKRSCTPPQWHKRRVKTKHAIVLTHVRERARERKTHDSSRIRSFHCSKQDPTSAGDVIYAVANPFRPGASRGTDRNGPNPATLGAAVAMTSFFPLESSARPGRKFACRREREREGARRSLERSSIGMTRCDSILMHLTFFTKFLSQLCLI